MADYFTLDDLKKQNPDKGFYTLTDLKAMQKPEPSMAENLLQHGKNALGGVLRGAGSIGATLAWPFESGAENDQRRARLDENAKMLLGADPESWVYKGGKLGGEIAGTAGMGGVIAKGAQAVPYLAQNAAPLISAINSSGMTTGAAMSLPKELALRAAGGAVTGGAAAGLVNPQDAAFGAGIGAALPPALKGAGFVGGKMADGVADMFLSKEAAMGRKVADIAGAKTRDEIKAMRDLLASPRPSNIGVNLTVPQIMQNPGISQLQRSVQNAGNASVDDAVRAQNTAMLAALDRVSPVRGTVQDAAQDAGNAISRFAKEGERAASTKASQLYQSVDPFGDVRLNLPIKEMQGQVDKFLGPGTYGMGDSARRAVSEAQKIGTEVLDGITPVKPGREVTMLQAIKQAGGIDPNAVSSVQLRGELKDLRGTGLGRIMNKGGKSVEKIAEDLYQRGFLPDEDPATMLNMLRNGEGGTVAVGDGMKSMQSAFEQAMGDAPKAERIIKSVPYEQVQNFRSSLVSDIQKLKGAPGNKSELAALTAMKKTLDDAVDNVANGGGAAGESFPADIAATWREANAAHAAKKARFNTGPQASLFRMGADGQSAVQGGEVPRQFFNSLRSQADDMAAFQNLAQGDKGITDALKNYAVTSASDTQGRLGNLTNAKFNNWLKGHSGAISGLFEPQEQAVFSQIGKHLKTADIADSLNIAKGSNTMQNINAAMSNGLLENPITSFVGNRIPYVKSFAGPILDGMKASARKGKAETLGGLLADPQALNDALEKYLRLQGAGGLLDYTPNLGAGQMLYRTAPLLSSGQ